MNADRLLAHYERIADLPDAIDRLRRFILDLAVRGKLVPQDANDEPVAKRYLIHGGASNLPANWSALNFGKFCDIEGGNQPPKSQFIDEPREGYVQLFQIRDLGERGVPTYIPIASARSLSKEGDILIGRYGASVGKVFWAQNGAYNVAMAKFIWPHDALIANFAFLLLKSDFLQEPLAKATRSAQAGFNKGDLTSIDFPLPPLAEQHRIVAKVDKLMGLCDRLEAARAGREAMRDRLAAASLARLNAPDPETFQADARFALDALPALTTRPDQIKRLRQTILNLAVRGKLVPQDPNDEPALTWLLRIFNSKVVGLGKKVKSFGAKPSNEVKAGYNLPGSWIWMELGKLVTDMDAGWSPQCENHPRSDPETWGVLKTTAVQTLAFDCGQHKELPTKFAPRPQHEARIGDILVTRAGPKNRVGISCVVDQTEPRLMISDKLIRFRLIDGLNPRFFALTLNAGVTSIAIEDAKSGMAVMQMNISQNKLRAVPVPLPPLAEQHRIVAKVDELMSLCDQLEASLAATAATCRRLLDALLAEALAPVDVAEMEAAE